MVSFIVYSSHNLFTVHFNLVVFATIITIMAAYWSNSVAICGPGMQLILQALVTVYITTCNSIKIHLSLLQLLYPISLLIARITFKILIFNLATK